MTEKIYVVLQQWEDKCGARDAQILCVTPHLYDARKSMQEERDEILANHTLTLEQIKHNDDYELEEDESRFFLNDMYGGWDEITILEKEVPQRDFISIGFYSERTNKYYSKRIYLDQIDPNHYDTIWDYWFSYKGNKKCYEVLGNKDEDGKYLTRSLKVNIYADEDANDPEEIANVYVRYDTRVNDID